jgi:hypothetical protein
MSSSDSLTGTRLSRYILLAPAGAGGMGLVFRARDERARATSAWTGSWR